MVCSTLLCGCLIIALDKMTKSFQIIDKPILHCKPMETPIKSSMRCVPNVILGVSTIGKHVIVVKRPLR